MDALTPEEQRVWDAAMAYARDNRQSIAKSLTSDSIYKREDSPMSVFMAGSPGAGKTEASKSLLAQFQEQSGDRILRIDADELRDYFDEYDGSNSRLFQGAVSLILERIHDLALGQCQSFVMDGTFSRLDKARQNVERSLRRDRGVQVLYVYQEPDVAWRFVQAREQIEGRRILPGVFAEQFVAAREVVNAIKREFGSSVALDLLVKDLSGKTAMWKANIDHVDYYLSNTYDQAAVIDLISGN